MIQITDQTQCCGCYACANICPKQCISMESDQDGFWYPKVDKDKCIRCSLCENVCPILHKSSSIQEPTAYAAYNKNDAVRMASSSGGIFTLLAEQVIRLGGVVFGAAFDQNFDVKHFCAEAIEDLELLRGSKYVQSRIGDTYTNIKERLETGKLVYFSGTPCQIAGLRAYLGKEYDRLICQDLICHGVPSPKVWQEYVAFRESKASAPVQKIFFRDKGQGWKKFSMLFLFKDNQKYFKTLDKDLMMQAFLRDLCLRPSCYDCQYKTLHRQSDLTLADFWGIENILPEMDDDKGISLVLVNSPKGQNLFNSVEKYMIYRETDLEEALRSNPSAYKSVPINPKRDFFFEELKRSPVEKVMKKYCTDSAVMKFQKNIRHVGSKIKRVFIQ